MEEQLISFETAKLAKEKGFNLYIKYFYKHKSNDEYEIVHNGHMKNNWNESFQFNHAECSAPTQSLLQKWLREEHQLHITIYSCSQESWMSRITRPGQKLEHGMYGEDYDTYEDALEDALYMALKTIE